MAGGRRGGERRGGRRSHRPGLSVSQRPRGEARCWLELFSDEQIQSEVPLTLVAGRVYTASGDPRLGGLWAGATLGERLDDSLTPDGGITLCGLQALLRAVTSAEGVTRMRADAELAAGPQAAFSPLWRSGAGALLGYARWLLGDNTGARDVLCLAVREGRASNVNAELGAHVLVACRCR